MKLDKKEKTRDYEIGKGKPPKAHQFKKGNIANPLGGNAVNPEVRELKRLSAAEIAEVGSVIIKGDLDELKRIAKSSTATVLQIWIASVAVKAINRGDIRALNELLNRVVGKVKERIELTGADGGPLKHLVAPMTAEECDREIKRLDELDRQIGSD